MGRKVRKGKRYYCSYWDLENRVGVTKGCFGVRGRGREISPNCNGSPA